MSTKLSTPKRTKPTRSDCEALLEIAGAVLRGYASYSAVIVACERMRLRLNKGRISRTLRVFDKFMGSDHERMFGLHDKKSSGMEINSITQAAIDWAWNDVAAGFGWDSLPSTQAVPSHSTRKVIRITTENFLAIHLLPPLIAKFNTKDSSPVFEIRESSSLQVALDDHLRNGTDLVIHTIRPASEKTKPTMPKLDGM